MLKFECALCKRKRLTEAPKDGQPVLCPDCLALPAPPGPDNPWPDLAPLMHSAPRHAMADDDDEDEEEEDEDEKVSAKPMPKGKKKPAANDEDDEKVSAKPMSRGKKKAADDEDDEDDDDDDAPRKKKAGGMGIGMILLIGGVLLVCCICTPAGIGVALLVPGLVGVQEAAARTQSINNLKQIGLSFHSFHDTHKRLPFNGSNQMAGGQKYSANALANNPMSGSWAFQVLPYLEQGGMYMTVDKTKGVPTYMCPGRKRPAVEGNGGGAWTDYFINNYLNDANRASTADNPDMRRKLVDIADGTSNTIMAGHGNINITQYKDSANVQFSHNIFKGGSFGTMRSGQNAQTNPGGVSLQKDGNFATNNGSWGGPFSSGALMVMGDGTVHTFPYTTANFSPFLTPNGGEVAMLP